MMNIHDKLLQVNDNEVLLIEYNSFFKELSDVCFFVIDDKDELKELNKILNIIKSIDNDASFFCYTYGVDKNDNNTFIYCDNLLINSFICIEELQSIFSKYDTFNNHFRGIVPSDMKILSEDDFINENIKYIIYDNGIVEEYQNGKEIIKINKVISLLWD